MKKILSAALVSCMVLSLAACGGSQTAATTAAATTAAPTEAATTAAPTEAATTAAAAETGTADYPKAGTVGNFYMGASVGSGGDINIRTLIKYMEPAMGITLVPENITGSRTIYNGIKKCVEAPADGYTFGYTLYPHVVTEQFNPNTSDNTLWITDYYALANLVSDSGLLAVRADDARFADVNSFSDLVDYMKETGDTLLFSACSVGGDDDILVHKIMIGAPEIAEQIVIVNGEAVSDGLTSLLGGTLDVFTGNVGDVPSLVEDGEIKVLTVFAEERSSFLPDVPTAKESGYDIIASTSRGVCISKDTDPAIIAIIEDYLDQIMADPAYIEDNLSQGYELNYMKHDEYEAWLKNEYDNFGPIAESYDWK